MDSTNSIPTKGDSEVCVALYSEAFLQYKVKTFIFYLVTVNSNKKLSLNRKMKLKINKVCHLGGNPKDGFKHCIKCLF